jgi:hypothetical protein
MIQRRPTPTTRNLRATNIQIKTDTMRRDERIDMDDATDYNDCEKVAG